MNPEHYNKELERLPATYSTGLSADLGQFKVAISGASESSIIGVGSGGSYTVASLLCNLHEAYTGRVSRPSTPLELICNPTLASSSPVFLVSAEGQNPDIVEALERARMHSARPIHVLTNKPTSALLDSVQRLSDVTSHILELPYKDGYLATNSLLLDAVLVARAYGELDGARDQLPHDINALSLNGRAISDWISECTTFAAETIRRGSLIVVFSPWLRPIASDLESKLSEAALCNCQLADMRSFAHGRHLWLANRSEECSVLALVEPSLSELWESMQSLFPDNVFRMTMPLDGATPKDLIAGLVAAMKLISRLAIHTDIDPGKPSVPEFGKRLYYLNLPDVIPPPSNDIDVGLLTKRHALGSRWPSTRNWGGMQRAQVQYVSSLYNQQFRAVVFDYDGTLASSKQIHDTPPPVGVMNQLKRFADAGVLVGIASGRGGSIQECLANVWPTDFLKKIALGLYNCGWISNGADHPDTSARDRPVSEFLSHVTRIMRRLQSYGVPIETIKTTHPYQVSVRFRYGIATTDMWFTLADTLRQAGLDLSRMVCSKHSIDVLAPNVDKSRLVAHMIHVNGIRPYEVLTIGDQGAWPGNDSSLLEHRFSLSVDVPSRRLDRGWKLAPAHKRDVDATSWYLDRFHIGESGHFQLSKLI